MNKTRFNCLLQSLSRIFLFLALIAGGFSVSDEALFAQSNRQLLEGDKKPPPVVPKTEAFKNAVQTMREHLEKLNETVVRYNVGAMSEDQKWRDQWNTLVAEGVPLNQAVLDAALAEFKADPKNSLEIANFLYFSVKNDIENDRLEGTLDIIEGLLEYNYPDPELRNFHIVAAFGLNEYDRCKDSLDIVVAEGRASQLLVQMHENFDEMKAIWAEEQRYREEDTKGEPLPRVLIRTTKGDMEIELFENHAPETVANFISLAESGFYGHQTFHGVIEHFMAQTGCPNGDGTGDPGYTVYGEMSKPNARKFFRGTLGLALAQSVQSGERIPDSGGSQFFITFLPTYSLNGNYTAFGRITKGIHVLGILAKIDPEKGKEKKKEEETKVMPDEILSIEVLNKRDHPYEPNKVVGSSVFGAPR